MLYWITKIKAKRKLLEFYYFFVEAKKKQESFEQWKKLDLLTGAIAYMLYTDFNCRNQDIVKEYQSVSDEDMRKYINTVVSPNYDYICHNINNIETKNNPRLKKGITVVSLEDGSIYEWDGENFIKIY